MFKQCQNALFDKDGWTGWPADAPPRVVWKWLADTIAKLAGRAATLDNDRKIWQRPLVQPNTRLQQRDKPKQRESPRLNIAFVSDPNANRLSLVPWLQCLVPGQIRTCAPLENAIAIEDSWLDFAVLAKRILTAQDTRRFVLAFTLFGSMMRVWQFDRLGGMISEQFDIHVEDHKIVLTMLGFLCA